MPCFFVALQKMNIVEFFHSDKKSAIDQRIAKNLLTSKGTDEIIENLYNHIQRRIFAFEVLIVMKSKGTVTKHDVILNKIIECVVKGTFKPDKKIYSEHQLANILGINRGKIRETISALEILGILRCKQGDGTYLVPFDFQNPSKALSLLIMLEQGEREEIIEVRRILETASVELSAINRTKEDLKMMKTSLSELIKTEDPAVGSEFDVNFHTIIGSSTGNPLLANLIHILTGYISQISSENWKLLVKEKNRGVRQIYDQHCAIYQAIYAKNPALARKEMENHLRFAQKVLSPEWVKTNGKGGE